MTRTPPEPPYYRHRHATERVCDDSECDVMLPPWDQHPMVVCNRHMTCTARSQGHG